MENLCRVCLKEGANIAIFDSKDEASVYTKLSLCVREKVEDLEGYPRNICIACYSTLEAVCTFIKQYKESHKVLESGLIPIKHEPYDNNTFDDNTFENNNQSDVEIEISLKAEPQDVNEVLEEPLKLKIDKLKHLSIKRVVKKEGTEDNECVDVTEEPAPKKKKKSVKKDTRLSLKEYKQMTLKQRKLKLLQRQKEIEERRKTKSKQNDSDPSKPDEPKPPKLCDICGDTFPSSDKLSYHKQKKHVDVPVQCPTCNRTCVSTYYLNRHIKRKHTEQKDFACQICGTCFAFKGELTSHYKSVHVKKTGPPRTWACKHCGKTYKCPKSVLVHERSVHTGERPAVCDICNTSFTHHDYLKEHMRLHTGETPFKCPICGRGYAQRCNMKSHLRIHKVSELNPEELSKLRPNYIRRLKV
ncbi:zinc finger protein 761-like [Leguminivora glycinivorella]|uniref:zinc finger protein 761-like n=1 Tax=Leguminivora glycinivorella TaxID=1035111 RepID=UPI00200C508F|nr:zinc finger protein 761-like [Leguminivora glycinivorella]